MFIRYSFVKLLLFSWGGVLFGNAGRYRAGTGVFKGHCFQSPQRRKRYQQKDPAGSAGSGFDEKSYRSSDAVNALKWDTLHLPEYQANVAYYLTKSNEWKYDPSLSDEFYDILSGYVEITEEAMQTIIRENKGTQPG